MKNIVITGSTGFVGQNLLQYGLKFFNFYKISREQLSNKDISIHADADVIIHLAGKAHDLKKVANPDEYDEVNLELTKRLYNAFLLSDVKKFIFISSVKAAADIVTDVLTENTQPDPKTDYGRSKFMAEQYIQSQPLPPGKLFYILRPCMIHGPGNKGNLNLLYRFIKKGIPYPLAGFSNKRSFLSIENLCFVIKELVTRNDIASGVYHVADDMALSTNEVVDILSTSLNKKAKLWRISPSLIRAVAKFGDIIHLPLTTERLNKLTESYVVSNLKLKQALSKELPLTAKEGLAVTAASFNKK